MRPRLDFELSLVEIPVEFSEEAFGVSRLATSEGNNAAWSCACGRLLIGRSYFQFGNTCHTKCPVCNRKYRVNPDSNKKALNVVQI
jgi:hypothetical protein